MNLVEICEVLYNLYYREGFSTIQIEISDERAKVLAETTLTED